ncbi:MAG: beta strand repeat-containing protein, partial [Reyranella sp.]
VEQAAEGIDLVNSRVSYVLGANVEKLTLLGKGDLAGTGNELDNGLTGNDGNNLLDGGNGNDRINGGGGDDTLVGGEGDDILNGGAGADTMSGGTDDDTYFVDSVGDTVVEAADEGTDLVKARVSYALGANLENLMLLGAANVSGTGNGLDNELTGNQGDNVLDGGLGNDGLYGEAGDDTLIGGEGDDLLMGGAGANTLIGGRGDDVYVVENSEDVVVELDEEGFDRVMSWTSFAIDADAEIEVLTLLGEGNNNGTGNSLTNEINGNVGNNVLDGGAGDDALYGEAGDDTLIGGEGNDTLVGGAGADTMSGGLGDDAYLVEDADDTVVELDGEGFDHVMSWTSFAIDADTEIEVLTLLGEGNNGGTGNSLANEINGNVGNNVLDGGVGADTMRGGLGNDVYIVDTIGDQVIEAIGEGIDRVESSVNYILTANVENLTLTGTANIDGIGNALVNTLIGNAGNNFLDGGVGADAMSGGAGDDTYFVENVLDTVTEAAGAGIDTVIAALDWTLGANVENLVLAGTADLRGTGHDGDNVLTGNGGNNLLIGGAGNDTIDGMAGADTIEGGTGNDTLMGGNGADSLDGGEGDDTLQGGAGHDMLDGGVGADAMSGGAGNDTYVVDDASDTVAEAVGEGVDTVFASVSYTLGANVENLTLTGDGYINATGNDLDNVLTGNGLSNTLDGGLGADTMVGGMGSDIYYVDDVGDVIVEASDDGIVDDVISTISYVLGANVENLELLGSAAIDATGNSLNNELFGNSGANILDAGAGNDTLNGRGGDDTMIGGMGNDIYFVDTPGDQVIEAVGQGIDRVNSAISYVLGANVENLTLTGSADIDGTGNVLNNTLVGNDGNNVLDGGAGADAMSGGIGNDTYIVDNVSDTVTEVVGDGIDTVITQVDWTLGTHFENLTMSGTANLSGTGNDQDNVLTGNDGDNVLIGGAGNDTLDGGIGVDAMSGGVGNDTYFVDDASDTVAEAVGEGVDTVFASVSYTLGSNVEGLILTGDGYINATGNDLDNLLIGNGLSNTLDGGLGADTMVGGMGQDIYHVDNVGDVIVEALGEGIDDVISTISYVLGANVENLELLGSAAIDATGNSLNNELFGNSGANILDAGDGNDTLNGRGGDDTMIGGMGNDIYFVDTPEDQVIEAVGQGTDRVNSAISYVLGANVENLTLTGGADIDGTGNVLDNILVGNAGNNVLDGGTGADTMSGGIGNDTYIVDNVSDTVTEVAGAGTDTVTSWVDWTLGANVENLILLGTADQSGTGNDHDNVLTGNDGSNVLIGGAGNDTLDGSRGADALEGGTGNDTLMGGNGADTLDGGEGDDMLYGGLGTDNLTGGTGSDSFVFDTAFTGTNKDTITDFNVADDIIILDDAIFSALSAGSLSNDAFRIGSAALDADDRIVFNAGTGALSYDADGNGSGLAVQFATLTSPTGTLTAADFLVV